MAGGLRITGGSLRGRVLKGRVPDEVRPTAARVREALFSMVGQDLEGLTVLDAYGGTGLLGLEALSRGARVTAVEQRPDVAKGIRAQAEALGVSLRVEVGDGVRLAATLGPFDGILADPPYAVDAASVVAALGPHARRWLVVECAAGARAPATAGALVLTRARSYGDTELWVYEAEVP